MLVMQISFRFHLFCSHLPNFINNNKTLSYNQSLVWQLLYYVNVSIKSSIATVRLHADLYPQLTAKYSVEHVNLSVGLV